MPPFFTAKLSRLALGVPFLTGLALASARAEIRINEIVTENLPVANWPGAPVDLDGESPDWIELYNPDAAGVNLQDWCLTDDVANLTKWTFPSVPINASGYLMVYASGKDRHVTGVQLHTNFKLSREGVLILSKPDGAGGRTVVSQLGNSSAPYPKQRFLASYGVIATTPSLTYAHLTAMTPNATNTAASAVAGFCTDTHFSVDRGFFDSPFPVAITCETPGASLVYTTNGSEPSETNGTRTDPPDAATTPAVTVNITGTTLLRARAVKVGFGSSNIDTQSYIFLASVLTQSAPPASLGVTAAETLNWSHYTTPVPRADWAMDPLIVNSADPEIQCRLDDLKALPTISVVMDWKGLFGPNDAGKTNGGIYPPATGVGIEGVDRAASMELLNPASSKTEPNTARGFQSDGNVHIFGGTSQERWKVDKLSMRFQCNENATTDIFGDTAATTSFSNFVLDARMNQTWLHGTDATQRMQGDYVRDQVMSDLQNAMGGIGVHSKNVHLFFNGLYWGIYVLHEKPDHHFNEASQGGDSEEWDVIKHNPGNVGYLVHSSFINPAQSAYNRSNATAHKNYEALLDLCGVGVEGVQPVVDLTTAAAYDAVAAKLDIDDFIKYMLLNFYGGNTDWAHQNWYASYNHNPDGHGRWRWHAWDAEHVFKSPGETGAITRNDSGGPTSVHQKLKVNTEYKLRFADLTHRYLFNGGLFTTATMQAFFDARLQVINDAIRAESARWGDNRKTPGYNRKNDWLVERDRILNNVNGVIAGRNTPVLKTPVLNALRTQLLYPQVAAPVFSQHGGAVPPNYALTITSAVGTIYFTTDGTDPRVAGTTPGAVSPTAQTYTPGTPVVVATSRTIKSRVFSGTAWSALNEAYFSVDTESASASNLVISKVHYHPQAASADEIAAGFPDRDSFEFLELMNIGSKAVDLSGVTCGAGLDHTFDLTSLMREIPVGGRALLVRSKAAMEKRYGAGLPIAGEFQNGSGLSNSGERLQLIDKNGSNIKDFIYNDEPPWPISPDGTGPALVLVRPSTNPDHTTSANWRPSTTVNGSPAADEVMHYNQWLAGFFTPAEVANPLVSGPSADPDRDGIGNALEQSFGLDPKVPGGSGFLPAVGFDAFTTGGGSAPHAVLSYRFVRAAEDVVLTPAISANLASWSVPPADPVWIDTLDHGDGTATARYRSALPVSAAQHLFFRVNATGP